jgi:tight adherence protein C
MEAWVLASALLAALAVIAAVLALGASGSAQRLEVLDRARRVTGIVVDSSVSSPKSGSIWSSILGPLAAIARPKEGDDMSRARKKLVYGGFRGERAVEIFFGSKVALAVLLGGGLFAANALAASPIPQARALSVVLVCVGFFAPNFWLYRRVRARQLAIVTGLADTLDLLVTCVEAGLGLEAAITRIAVEIEIAAPELSSELRQTTMEIQAGVVRASAFRRMAERTGVEELRTLSAMIIQTELFGTTVARALRVHSVSMRTRRAHLAEEKGAIASVKMMLPLVLCILPSLFTVVLGPGVVRIVTLLMPSLGANH